MSEKNTKEATVVEEENIDAVKKLENGQYQFPTIEVYDKNDNLIEVNILAQKMINGNNFNKALSKFESSGDIVEMARQVMPSMIIEPVQARKVDFFENDYEALNVVLGGLLHLQLERKNKKTRKLNIQF